MSGGPDAKLRTIRPPATAIHHRLSVLGRIAAATLGAYALTALVTMLLAQLLALAGTGQAQAVLAATIPAFLIYATLVCAIFHARSARRAWARLAAAAVPIGGLVWCLAQGFPA